MLVVVFDCGNTSAELHAMVGLSEKQKTTGFDGSMMSPSPKTIRQLRLRRQTKMFVGEQVAQHYTNLAATVTESDDLSISILGWKEIAPSGAVLQCSEDFLRGAAKDCAVQGIQGVPSISKGHHQVVVCSFTFYHATRQTSIEYGNKHFGYLWCNLRELNWILSG